MNLKKELDNKIFDIVKNASEKLGYESFVVGGWVRDLKKFKKDLRMLKVPLCATLIQMDPQGELDFKE